ncbi:hypothetical protein EJ02DRAFT_130222 [Clathrospora elynae]|uniref:Uncharacterized protein n=1 Tax=Clathrospora elynae TaxID=706981 RepID=A0A6A5SW70_9PLEO|nr:hypothetical protein EJ02DRAFT_130222 [Clathrospora elynae]
MQQRAGSQSVQVRCDCYFLTSSSHPGFFLIASSPICYLFFPSRTLHHSPTFGGSRIWYHDMHKCLVPQQEASSGAHSSTSFQVSPSRISAHRHGLQSLGLAVSRLHPRRLSIGVCTYLRQAQKLGEKRSSSNTCIPLTYVHSPSRMNKSKMDFFLVRFD